MGNCIFILCIIYVFPEAKHTAMTVNMMMRTGGADADSGMSAETAAWEVGALVGKVVGKANFGAF